jgi:uncharacterized protein YkwD
LVVAAAWASISSASAAASCPGEDVQAAGLTEDQLQDSVTCLINERRADNGLRPVRVNDTLRQAAFQHSADMVNDGYFAHTAPGGSTFIDRIESVGYMRGARSWLVGENLVWGSGEMSSPASMVEAWMNSPPHRENLLRARFREVGVSAVKGTPVTASDDNGVTISSEYGYRGRAKTKAKLRHRSRSRSRSRH